MNAAAHTDIEEDVEQALVGSLMLDYEGASIETEPFAITADMFVSRLARLTFEAVQALALEKSPIDPLTVRDKIGKPADPAITPYLTATIDNTPTAAHAAYYAQLLRLKHEKLRLRGVLYAAARRLDHEPADMVQADLMRQLERHDPNPADDGTTLADASTAAVEMFRRAAEGRNGVKTGFAFIDSAGGLQTGALVVVSGKAGSCKTTLARQMLMHICGVEKIPAALITLEMSEEQIAGQTLTDISRTSFRKFMAGTASASDWNRLFSAKAKAEGWPLHITAKARTPSRLAAYARAAVRRGARVIVLDYLQALQPDPIQARLNIEQQVSFSSNTVRDLATGLGVIFIVVSTESRDGELRYSDAIRYDAWLWIQMQQPEENNQDNPVYHLAVKKNRFGVLPKVALALYRVGDRLLSSAEWQAHNKHAKGQKESE